MKCNFCGQDRPEDEFFGHPARCRKCQEKMVIRPPRVYTWNPDSPMTCTVCGETKPAKMFKFSEGRFRNPCKACHVIRTREGMSAEAKRKKGRMSKERSACKKVYRALKAGKLTKGECEGCGSLDVQAHHDDYNKPLEVRWFCQTCHDIVHGKSLYLYQTPKKM